MMFLLRLSFWILLICLLLPGSREDNAKMIDSAEKAVQDFSGFCGRNPDVCNNAGVVMSSMLTKVKSGADLLSTWIASKSENKGDKPVGIQPSSQPAAKPEPVAEIKTQWRDSLMPNDKSEPWQGPRKL